MTFEYVKIFDKRTGAPIEGASPTWHAFVDAVTLLPVTPTPTFTPITGGRYIFEVTVSTHCGIIDCGTDALEQYKHLRSANPETFHAMDLLTRAPKTGLSLVVTDFRKLSDLSLQTAPLISEVGSGIYKLPKWLGDPCSGVIDCGAACDPRYLDYQTDIDPETPETDPPLVLNVSPSAGSAIARETALTFDIVDDSAFRDILIVVKYPSIPTVWEVAWDGTAFNVLYSGGSTRTATTVGGRPGYHFELNRYRGWLAAPQVLPVAIDRWGNENA